MLCDWFSNVDNRLWSFKIIIWIWAVYFKHGNGRLSCNLASVNSNTLNCNKSSILAIYSAPHPPKNALRINSQEYSINQNKRLILNKHKTALSWVRFSFWSSKSHIPQQKTLHHVTNIYTNLHSISQTVFMSQSFWNCTCTTFYREAFTFTFHLQGVPEIRLM